MRLFDRIAPGCLSSPRVKTQTESLFPKGTRRWPIPFASVGAVGYRRLVVVVVVATACSREMAFGGRGAATPFQAGGSVDCSAT